MLKTVRDRTTTRGRTIHLPPITSITADKNMAMGMGMGMGMGMSVDMDMVQSTVTLMELQVLRPPMLTTSSATQEKRKRGRKPKPRPESDDIDTASALGTSGPKESKLKGAKGSNTPKEKKIKEPKTAKEPKQKKAKGDIDGSANTGFRERSILSFFDRSTSASSVPRPISTFHSEAHRGDGQDPSVVSPTKASQGYRQSCLMFDVLEPSKSASYFANMISASKEDDQRFGVLMKEMPKLTGRAPYEDLMAGMLVRSTRLPTLNKLNMENSEINMDMLADVKMVHEFLNTFGTPLGLTKVSGEWIAFDLLLSMIRNPRIDNRLIDLQCKMISAAYEGDQSPQINQFNFPYFLAVGPEAMAEENKEDRKNKYSASSRKKTVPLNRLGTIEYSNYTIADRIEALVKALHDITASDRFHRFMRDNVEENITALKRQKRKRTEVRKELESQTQELEREMKAIEREAAELESKRQAILAPERENGPAEDESGSTRITAASRLQKLAQTKDARSKANDLLNQQKALANDLKAKESEWESKKEELDDISLDDTETQRDHNVPWTQLRGGHIVNTDEKLRIVCLGSDRWGRKFWFWREFGGVIVEDRGQIGPIRDESSSTAPPNGTDTKQPTGGDGVAAVKSESAVSVSTKSNADEDSSSINDPLNEVTLRMKTMAEPELAGDKTRVRRDDRMSINNLLSVHSPEESSRVVEPVHESGPVKPVEKDPLDYGLIQTWCLISTAKELASVTRALNGKGVRERVLKASLTTMRKEIEASFDRIKTWAGREYATKNDQLVSVMGAVGQPLSQEDLLLLKKKRGRKSRQELADIAATQKTLGTTDASCDDSMEVDLSSSSHPDVQMDETGSDHEQQQQRADAEGAISQDDHDPTEDGFFAATRDSNSGPMPLEYFESIVQAADHKLRDLSRAICDGNDEDAILSAVHDIRKTGESQELLATVQVLSRCLQIMDEPLMEVEDQEDQKDQKGQEEGQDDSKSQELPKDADHNKQQGQMEDDTNMDVGDTKAPELPSSVLSLSIPVSVNPRLLAWLKTCRIDVMLQNVKTFGALHAWLDESIVAIESAVYDADEDDENENGVEGIRKRKQEDNDAEEEEQDDEDEDGDDEDENDHEEEEGEEAGDEKAQEEDQENDDEDEDEDRHRRRQRKTRQEPRLRATTIRGRTLRARSNRTVSYKDFKEEEEDSDREEEEGIGSRLRRSKRVRH
ncbi:hypothetical protein BGX34_009833 [Mortierella sp. NVP85]|nr:hypothetical protein BGX34_009833 [Mortierella sp. NVP85]